MLRWHGAPGGLRHTEGSEGSRLSVSAPLRWLDCRGAHGSSRKRPQTFLRALGALRALFECITNSASQQDSSGKHPQHFLSALSALFHLFKCIPRSASPEKLIPPRPHSYRSATARCDIRRANPRDACRVRARWRATRCCRCRAHAARNRCHAASPGCRRDAVHRDRGCRRIFVRTRRRTTCARAVRHNRSHSLRGP